MTNGTESSKGMELFVRGTCCEVQRRLDPVQCKLAESKIIHTLGCINRRRITVLVVEENPGAATRSAGLLEQLGH